MSLSEIGMQENVENRRNSEYVMILENEGEKRKPLPENSEIIRLNNDLITINQSQIKKIVKAVLKSDDPEKIRQQYSELCIQYKDIWIKLGEYALEEDLLRYKGKHLCMLLHFWTTQIGKKCLKVFGKTPIRSNYFVDASLTIPNLEVDLLEKVLSWEKVNLPQDGKINRRVMVEAALTNNATLVAALYDFDYRIDVDFLEGKAIDHVNMCRLYDAASSFTYLAVEFEVTELDEVEELDPLARLFEFARRARDLANEQQDFTVSYTAIKDKCEKFACSLLSACKTTHEVQILLQTRKRDAGLSSNPNFSIALLDGHRQFVSHEKFQQQLHRQWQEQRRSDQLLKKKMFQRYYEPKIKVNWSEKSDLQKVVHVLRQIGHFFLLWLLTFWSVFNRYSNIFYYNVLPPATSNTARRRLTASGNTTESNKRHRIGHVNSHSFMYRNTKKKSWLERRFDDLENNASVPLNKFIYWEFSKVIYYILLIITLIPAQVDGKSKRTIGVSNFLSIYWTLSYLVDNVRLIQQLRELSPSLRRAIFRWLSFRNVFTVIANISFVCAFIIQLCAWYAVSSEEDHSSLEIVGSTLWALACLMAFLRSIQFGLMSRQAGPVIISMSYMMLDILRFVGFFLVVYFSFTFCTTYVYVVYEDFNQNSKFADYKNAFKYFFWALIRTGNPEFADIKIPVYSNSTEAQTEMGAKIDGHCLQDVLRNNSDIQLVSSDMIQNCFYFINATLSNDNGTSVDVTKIYKNDEGFFVIVGNILWSSYQFLLVIVLLSILRAKMINTYQNIIQEADVQWKFFRAELWWKYLDSENVWAPPPFTFIDLLERAISRLRLEIKHKAYLGRQETENPNALSTQLSVHINHQSEIRNEFLSKYKELLLLLLANIDEITERDQNKNMSNKDPEKDKEEEAIAGCEAGAE